MDNIKGHLLLLLAPSGSGKRLLVEGLGGLKKELYFAKTYTSRQQRAGAKENPKYVFFTEDEFQQKIDGDEFIEWANFSGNFYGTPKEEFTEPLKEGKLVFKEMELQGIEQIRKIVPKENMTVVYVEAGGWEVLKQRVLDRASISEEELELRYQHFIKESQAKEEADVVIENFDGQLEEAQTNFAELIVGLTNKISE